MKRQILYAFFLGLIVISCEEILFEENITDEIVSIIAPTNNAVVENNTVNFSWETITGATKYRLQIAQPNFANAAQILEDTLITGANYRTTLTPANYEWKIRAQNESSETEPTTTQFRVEESQDFSAREVILISPADAQINSATQVNLQWTAVTDATIYRIQILNESNVVVQEETTTSTSIQLTFPEGNSSWQVRAENQTQSTLYTSRSLMVDSMNPRKPILVSPTTGTTQDETTVNFTWTREAVAGTTEFDSIYLYTNPTLTALVNKDRATSPKEITVIEGDTYYWIVRAFDEAGNQSEVSDVFNIIIN